MMSSTTPTDTPALAKRNNRAFPIWLKAAVIEKAASISRGMVK